MFSRSTLALSAVLLVPAGGVILAPAPASAWSVVADPKTDDGSIKSVDVNAKSFVLTVGTGPTARDVSIKFNDATTYTLDGKPSTMDKALIAGNKAKVKHTDGVANAVDATTVKKP